MARKNQQKSNNKQKSQKPAGSVKTSNQKKKPSSSFNNHPLFSAKSSRIIEILVFSLVIVGFTIRVLNLDSLSLWVDEYVHVMRAKGVVMDTGNLFSQDNTGILLTMVIIPFFELFDISDFWARIPSVLFGAGSIFLTYLLGKRLFNNLVGIIAAILNTGSIFLIFWSRVARNYSIFEFFFLGLLIIFLLAFENKEKSPKKLAFFDQIGINGKWLLVLPVALVLSILSHQLTFFFVFGAGAFFFLKAIFHLLPNKEVNKIEKKRDLILGGVFAIVMVLIFFPIFSPIVEGLLGLFLPEKYITWFLPDWDYISKMWDEKPYDAFNGYFNIISYDFNYLYWLGLAGFIVSYFINKRSANFLLAVFWVPFLLMSFIFRDPSLPRYLIYLYPIFLISTSAFICGVAKLLNDKLLNGKTSLVQGFVTILLVGAFVLPAIPMQAIDELINGEKDSGNVVDKKLSTWYFTNWKYPINYVSKFYKPGDVVFSTVPKPVDFYLGIDYTKRFRQRHLDTELRQYVMNDEPEGNEYHAKTTQGFINAVNSYPRGWLIADYYFYNALTDAQARQFAIQNLTYHFDAGKDGVVNVFSWDRTKPGGPKKSILVVLGKGNKVASNEMTMDMKFLNQGSKVRIVMDVEGIDHGQEAILVVNKKNSVYIPKPRSNGREQVYVDLDKSWFKPQGNTIQFGYNQQKVKGLSGNIDFRQGFAVYNVSAGPV